MFLFLDVCVLRPTRSCMEPFLIALLSRSEISDALRLEFLSSLAPHFDGAFKDQLKKIFQHPDLLQRFFSWLNGSTLGHRAHARREILTYLNSPCPHSRREGLFDETRTRIVDGATIIMWTNNNRWFVFQFRGTDKIANFHLEKFNVALNLVDIMGKDSLRAFDWSVESHEVFRLSGVEKLMSEFHTDDEWRLLALSVVEDPEKQKEVQQSIASLILEGKTVHLNFVLEHFIQALVKVERFVSLDNNFLHVL